MREELLVGIGQLFWFDELGTPEAAVVVTDFGDGSSAVHDDPIIVVIVIPGSSPEWIEYVVERGLAHVRSCGIQQVAAHGLFWYDDVTATGVVEPMRTLDQFQRSELARHVLTAGIDRLAAAGATRISIAFEPDNTAARHLYLIVRFVPHRQTDAFSRQLA